MFDTTPTGKTDMETVLAALNASSEAISCRFDHFEAGLADLKASNTMATIGATPGSPRSPSPRMPSVPAVGTKPGVAFRPLQTPMHGTPTACGVSGFYVPVTPKKAKDTADVGMGLSDEASVRARESFGTSTANSRPWSASKPPAWPATRQAPSILAPIQGATEILGGIEHGCGYLEDQPDVETDNYDLRLDLEIGGLVVGSVSAECRGYVVARQSAGEYRGSVLWRDLVSVRRGDSVDKALIFEEVIRKRQEPNEGVRPYAERLRSNFVKLGAINAPLSFVDQVMYLLRGLQPRMDTHRTAVRAYQRTGTAYTFDSALSFLIQQETAAILDLSQGPNRLSLLSRSTANLASGETPGPVRRFHILRNTAAKGQPGYFNGECRHCHRRGHQQDDCAQCKREIDAGTIEHKPASARAAQAKADVGQEDPLSDAEGTSTRSWATTEKTQAAAEVPDWTETELDDFGATHVPEKAVKWILDSGATHHMPSRSELLPMRVTATEDAVVHIADATSARIERREACLASMYGDGGTEAKATLLKTVLVVPSFTNILLSVQRLAEEEWTVKFARSGAELVSPKGDKVQTFTEPGTGAPYVMLRSQPVRYIDIKGSAKRIRMGPAKATARAATVDDSKLKEQATLWHKRLAHPSYYNLRILAGSPTFARADRPSPRIFAQIIAEEE
ncbi:unnamed protein product [Tilletia caries]|uniref:Retrovirus-related Pol polyprotein from transposon TNT 1-94-like beta-barrel domain-containing protein n=2 Tax=Tilletia caries TaxID=13290 RepID=A0ABN7IQX3_9BASI|nr:unnamed protein product [Tilletia caries]